MFTNHVTNSKGLFSGRQLWGPALLGAVLLLEPNCLGQEPQKPSTFRQDFRGREVNEEFFRYTGTNPRQQIQVEPEGLRIRLPAEGDPKLEATGLVLNFPVTGDFEITTSYELLRADRPTKSWGTGVTLYVITKTPSKEAVMLGRLNRLKEGDCYSCDYNTTPPGQTRQYKGKQPPDPTEARSGKLRLVRRGAIVTYWVAEEGKDEFRLLHESSLGPEDTALVRVAADTQEPNAPVDVRILDFEVRAVGVPETTAASAPPMPTRRWALFLAIALFFLLVVAGVCVLWSRRRHTKDAEETEAESAQPD